MGSFTLDFRPNEANAFCKPNEHLRFGYPVKNLDGTHYNEPLLTDVEVKITPLFSNLAPKTFNFTNGTSHAYGTNIIAFDLSIVDAELPIGKYTWTINHKRIINLVIENNVMFEGVFEVTTKHRTSCDIIECNVGNISIVNVEGLREELDSIKNENDDLVIFQDFVNVTPGTIALHTDFLNLGLVVFGNGLREGLTRKFNIFDLEACSMQTAKKFTSIDRRIILETRILTPYGFPFIDNLSQTGNYYLNFGIINLEQNFAVSIRIVQNEYVLIWNNGLNSFSTGITPAVEPVTWVSEAPTNFDRLKIVVDGLTIDYYINGTKYNQTNTVAVNGYASIKVETEDFLSNDSQDFGLTIDYFKVTSSR